MLQNRDVPGKTFLTGVDLRKSHVLEECLRENITADKKGF